MSLDIISDNEVYSSSGPIAPHARAETMKTGIDNYYFDREYNFDADSFQINVMVTVFHRDTIILQKEELVKSRRKYKVHH